MNSFNEKLVKESLEIFLTKSRYNQTLKENLDTKKNPNNNNSNFQTTLYLINLLKKLLKGFPFKCSLCSTFKILKKNYEKNSCDENNIFFCEKDISKVKKFENLLEKFGFLNFILSLVIKCDCENDYGFEICDLKEKIVVLKNLICLKMKILGLDKKNLEQNIIIPFFKEIFKNFYTYKFLEILREMFYESSFSAVSDLFENYIHYEKNDKNNYQKKKENYFKNLEKYDTVETFGKNEIEEETTIKKRERDEENLDDMFLKREGKLIFLSDEKKIEEKNSKKEISNFDCNNIIKNNNNCKDRKNHFFDTFINQKKKKFNY